MAKFRITLALGALLVQMVPIAAQAIERLPEALARITPAEFARQVRVVDDPLEHDIVFTTRHAYRSGQSLSGARANDVHLRALVDRHSGKTTWQVWHELVTTQGVMDITTVRFVSAGMTASVSPSVVQSWQERCPAFDGNMTCDQYTRVVFELPDHTVREIAAGHIDGSRQPWRLRFKDASGRDVTSGLAPAEAAGLLQAVNAWREQARRAG